MTEKLVRLNHLNESTRLQLVIKINQKPEKLKITLKFNGRTSSGANKPLVEDSS